MHTEHFGDPVAAYDKLAPQYSAFARRRELYLRAVENQIVLRISGAAQSLLDIGSGDGIRALRIAATANLARVTLVEPSAAMAAAIKPGIELWRLRAEELDAGHIPDRFDAITCLWNVLGHVPATARTAALTSAAQLLSARGQIFLDVNHRYNARSYGWVATCARWIRDTISRNPRTGDVTASWKVGTGQISTYGHVFTHREIARLVRDAGLQIHGRIIIDYENGLLRQLPWLGNLLYILRRSSPIDSSSAPATS